MRAKRKTRKSFRIIRWILRSDERTARALMLLTPMCQAVIAVCGTTVVAVAAVLIGWALGGAPVGMSALGICAVIGGTVAWRRLRALHSVIDDEPKAP